MAHAATAPRTWILALVLVALLDAAITRTAVLWGRTSFESTRDMARIVFAQTYQVARKLYLPAAARTRIALLGNSRLWLTARETFLAPELDRLAPGRDLRAENLAIFGAGVGDLEVLSRHLDRLDPALVVVALASSDLIDTPASPIAGVPSQLLAIGWRDGPLPAPDAAARFDRWGRTVWPLFRFREFARAAIEDRIVAAPGAPPFPAHFADVHAVFTYMHGAKAEGAERAWEAWRRDPTLARYVAYLEVGSASHLALVRERTRLGASVVPAATPALRVIDALLARLAASRAHALVVLMPENPLLALDTRGEFHRPDFSDDAAAAIGGAAARHRVPVIDARRWMAAEAFIDFDHLLPDVSGFQRPLAEEIVRALDG